MLPSIKYRNTSDLALNTFQSSTVDAFQALAAVPFLDGVWLRDVALTTSSVDIPHKLGRTWQGYFVTKIDANKSIYTGTGTSDTAVYISLRATGAVTVDLWVF